MTSIWVSLLLCLLLASPSFARTRFRNGNQNIAKRSDLPETCERSVDVAIVGGGAAGTYSAYRLREADLNIELFEYSDRIGGRLYTGTLPNTPDVNLELGGMRFIEGAHTTLQRLVSELDLTSVDFVEGFGKPGRARVFLRGQSLTLDQVKHGDVPYDLTPEEKDNQANLCHYYLEKLTGYNESYIPRDQVLKLKLISDGRELYKLEMDEALDMVASPEGKEFLKDVAGFETMTLPTASAVSLFNFEMGEYSHGGNIVTVKEGMSAVPNTMVKKFLQASDRHKLTTKRKLLSIDKANDGRYILDFVETETADGFTTEKAANERVCAAKVILGIPQRALTELDWAPLQSGRVKEALNAVEPVPASKVFMTFNKPWWLGKDADFPANVTKSDTDFCKMYDWKHSDATGDFIMIASYADMSNTLFMKQLNAQGQPIEGSAAGFNKVTDVLSDDLLDHLAEAFGIKRDLVSDPVTAISQWWTSYPFGGGWTHWRAGFHFDDVRLTIRRPSLTDDVFIVGSDHAFSDETVWVEGALGTVDDVIDAYF